MIFKELEGFEEVLRWTDGTVIKVAADDSSEAYALHWHIAHEHYAVSLGCMGFPPEPPHIQEALKERADKLLFAFEMLRFRRTQNGK